MTVQTRSELERIELKPLIGTAPRAEKSDLLSMHRVMAYPEDSGRLMHRTTVQGDEPFA